MTDKDIGKIAREIAEREQYRRSQAKQGRDCNTRSMEKDCGIK